MSKTLIPSEIGANERKATAYPYGALVHPILDAMLDVPPSQHTGAHEGLVRLAESAKAHLESVKDFLIPGAVMTATGVGMFAASFPEASQSLANWGTVVAIGGSAALLAAASHAVDGHEASDKLKQMLQLATDAEKSALEAWRKVSEPELEEAKPGAMQGMFARLKSMVTDNDSNGETERHRSDAPRG